MTQMIHRAIVVTTNFAPEAELAYDEARKMGLRVTEPRGLATAPVSFVTFVVLPDGTSEGTHDNLRGREIRDQFKSLLAFNMDQAGNPTFAWFEAAYGGDPAGAQVVDHAWTVENLTT